MSTRKPFLLVLIWILFLFFLPSAVGEAASLVSESNPVSDTESVAVPAITSARDAGNTVEADSVRTRDAELLRLHQINIGTADAYLLTVGNLVILVDCGTSPHDPLSPDMVNAPLFEYLEASGIDHVDVHFVTHWHKDHAYNVDTLSELYGTENTVVYGPSPELDKDLAPLPAGVYRQLKDGDQLSVGPLEILCISPPYKKDLRGRINRESLNFIITFQKHRFLFTGDYMDWTLYRRWQDILADIDVLSFPHHGIGNPFAVTKNVYRLVNPRVVLNPGADRGIIRQFAIHTAGVGQDAIYLCTRDGNLLVTSDGENLWVATDVQPGEFPLGEPVPPRAKKD